MALISKEYVFKETGNGLQFVGDFNSLYADDSMPWGQDGNDKRLKAYYNFSRKNLIRTVKRLKKRFKYKSALDIGCGLGYVTAMLAQHINVVGSDVSDIAVSKAKEIHTGIDFFAANICSPDFKVKDKFDIVIVNGVLWYLLDSLPQVFNNIKAALNPGGSLIIVHSFLENQRYGKDVIDGFDGLVRYLVNEQRDFCLLEASIHKTAQMEHADGIVVTKYSNSIWSTV